MELRALQTEHQRMLEVQTSTERKAQHEASALSSQARARDSCPRASWNYLLLLLPDHRSYFASLKHRPSRGKERILVLCGGGVRVSCVALLRCRGRLRASSDVSRAQVRELLFLRKRITGRADGEQSRTLQRLMESTVEIARLNNTVRAGAVPSPSGSVALAARRAGVVFSR